MNKKILAVLTIILMFSLVFVAGKIFIKEEVLKTQEQIVERCSDLSLKETSYCLRNSIKPSFNYILNNDYPENLNLVLENGGDCSDYTLLYKEMFEELGFETTKIFSSSEDEIVDHVILMAWDDNYICEIDLMEVDCHEI